MRNLFDATRFDRAQEDLAPFLAVVRDGAVRHALGYGVGLLHEGLSEPERAAVEALFESGAICWGLPCAGRCVVVMGTQYFDAALSSGAADYPMTDLLQMMGRAGRPGIDERGTPPFPCFPRLSSRAPHRLCTH